MVQQTGQKKQDVTDIIKRYGRCLDLVSMDPHLNEITVGLYLKDTIATVWTYSQIDGIDARMEQIRDLLVLRGGMEPVSTTHNQVRHNCGTVHERPLKFLIKNCVEKSSASWSNDGPIDIRDFRTRLKLTVTPLQEDNRTVYKVSGEGDHPNPDVRVRAVVGGFMRYGEMERVTPSSAAFTCGYEHNELVRLLLPSARNVSSVEDMFEAESLKGQMTTQTLGFSSSP